LKNDFLGMKYPCLDFPTTEALLVYENRLNFFKNKLEVERVIFIEKRLHMYAKPFFYRSGTCPRVQPLFF